MRSGAESSRAKPPLRPRSAAARKDGAPRSDGPIRVVVVHGRPVERAAICLALVRRGFDVRAEADAPAAVSGVLRERPDVCLLELAVPGNALQAIEEIRSLVPETAVVVLSDSRESEDFLAALHAGVSGYVLRDIDPDRIAVVLERVISGEAAVPRALVAPIIEELRERRRRRLHLRNQRGIELTSREWEVLDLLRHRLTTSDIADRLMISTVTVRRHAGAIVRKLGARDREAALELVDRLLRG
jgi:DNA-binding NarL/FixJ family response regulator